MPSKVNMFDMGGEFGAMEADMCCERQIFLSAINGMFGKLEMIVPISIHSAMGAGSFEPTEANMELGTICGPFGALRCLLPVSGKRGCWPFSDVAGMQPCVRYEEHVNGRPMGLYARVIVWSQYGECLNFGQDGSSIDIRVTC